MHDLRDMYARDARNKGVSLRRNCSQGHVVLFYSLANFAS